MLLSAEVLALLWGSAVAGGVTVMAAGRGLTLAWGWNPDASGRRQLERERTLLLVEAALTVVLALQMLSLFAFIATADRLHSLFPGAMCAAGTLAASRFGYPTLAAKVAVFLTSGLWLVVHHASRGAAGSGVVRAKQLFVAVIAAAVVGENILQWRYFSDLEPEILTSCCATIFADGGGGVAAELATLPVEASRGVFLALLALTLGVGLAALVHRSSPLLYSPLAVALGAVSLAAVVTWVAPGFYQLPTHHCPFCLLAREYGFVGYPLYLFLSVAVIAGGGAGLVHALRRLDRPGAIPTTEECRLCFVSVLAFACFSLLAVWPLLTAEFRPGG